MIIVIVSVMLLSLWLIGNIEADTLTSCRNLSSISLTDKTIPLKILSCTLLVETIKERYNKGDRNSLKPYIHQWLENCRKTDESDLFNQGVVPYGRY